MSVILSSLCCGARTAGAIDINPENQVGPTVQRWGWDIKGSQDQTSTPSKAQLLYGDVPANMIRIPIWVNGHFSDGSVDTSLYSNEITSILNAKAVNPDVEVFASVKLQGGDSFVGPASEPGWVTQGTAQWPAGTGSIFGNPAPRPNPEFYSQLVADFFDYMGSQGIEIDYLGINNETDGALGVPRYIDTVDRLDAELVNRGYDLADFQYIAPDTFAPNGAINVLNTISGEGRLDTVDIVGSHQYPAFSGHTSDKWQTMASISGGKDMWHTEVHMNSSGSGNGGTANTNITRMRRGMGVMFSANLSGVDSFVWWAGGSNTGKISQTLRREIIKSTLDGHPVESPSFNEQDPDPDAPLYQAYRKGDLLTLWVAHPEFSTSSSFPVDLLDGHIATEGSLTVTGEYWQGGAGAGAFGDDITPGTSGNLSITVNGDNQGFVIGTVPENSISKISVVMTGALVWNQGSGNFDQGFARSDGFQNVGATGVDPFGYGGTENLYIANGGSVTLDGTTDTGSGTAVESLRVGTDKASDRIANRNGFGVLNINDAVSLTVGDGTTQVGDVGNLTVGEGGFQGLVTLNSTGTLNVEGKLRVGQGGQGFFTQNNGTVVAGETGGSDKFIAVANGPGSDGSIYALNNGTLVLGGGLTGGQLRELRIGSDASGDFFLGDGSGPAGSAAIETRRHVYVGHNGGTGTLAISADGQLTQVTDGAHLTIGHNGGQGTVTQNGGAVSGEHHVRIGNGVGSVGEYTLSAGVLNVAVDGSGELSIGEAGGQGSLRVEGSGIVNAGAELFVAKGDSSSTVGVLEIVGSSAGFSIGKLDNAFDADETISWVADVGGLTPITVRGDVPGGSLFVELQHPSEIAANLGGMGDGIALDIDLSAYSGSGTLMLIDNLSAEPVQGFFENPLVPNDLFEEGESIPGTGFAGSVSISYTGGSGNDVVLTLTSGNADFDGDGDVDGADLMILQRGFGLTGQVDNSNGDANGDGLVNGGDLTEWRAAFGVGSSPITGVTAVPEPSAFVLSVCMLVGLVSKKPRSDSRKRRND